MTKLVTMEEQTTQTKTMRALVKEERGFGAVLKEVEVPVPGRGEVLIRVEATSICGTDVHLRMGCLGRVSCQSPIRVRT